MSVARAGCEVGKQKNFCRYAWAMKLKIVQAGEPVLRRAARPLTPAEIASQEIQQLIELMRETMRDAPGVGLAAPQIGLPLALAVIEDSVELEDTARAPVPFHVIVNPRSHSAPRSSRPSRAASASRGCRRSSRAPAPPVSRRSTTAAPRSRSTRRVGTRGSCSTRSTTSAARSTSTACARARWPPRATWPATGPASRSARCSRRWRPKSANSVSG